MSVEDFCAPQVMLHLQVAPAGVAIRGPLALCARLLLRDCAGANAPRNDEAKQSSGSRTNRAALSFAAGGCLALIASAADAADLTPKEVPASYAEPSAYDWTGFYLGGHIGYAWGNSNWTATGPAGQTIASGSLDFSRGIDVFDESGSWFEGLQIGYNYMLANRLVIGAEADATFPPFPKPTTGLGIGGTSTLLNGTEVYSDNVLVSGMVRARIGYAPRDWLYYATAGAAWSYDQVSLTQTATGAAEAHKLMRWGVAAGAGVEAPVTPHWTAKLEYLFTGYNNSSVDFQTLGQRFNSDLSLHEVRVGLNYQFGGGEALSEKDAPKRAADADNINFHGQTTATWQGYPVIRSPFEGPNSLPGGGEGREVADTTLFAGLRLWKGAELWVDPEIDQGFGFADTHGVAGFPNGESFKRGSATPYARLERAFIRQTIDLGGETQKVEADQNQFAGSTTADRLVLTAGRFFITDLFDTNKYANNPKSDFLNWAMINAGTFDYAGDGWGSTYGAAAEWYQGRWTLRGGIFDLSTTPAGGISPLGGANDPTFKQLEFVGEIERRYELWGQPGKLKITGYLEDGRMGAYADAIAFIQANPGADPGASINAVRRWNIRPGVSLNLEQQASDTVGVFARAGWGDGNLEPWDFTDIDWTIAGGASISGKQWGKPDDTVGIAGIVNDISGIHQAFFNAGGLGILIGDGKLPHPGLETILETYYSYALTSSTKLAFDYQLIGNPAYNTSRGPVNVVAGRVHWQF